MAAVELSKEDQAELIKRARSYSAVSGHGADDVRFEIKDALVVTRAKQEADGTRVITFLLTNGKNVAMRADPFCCGVWDHGTTGVAIHSSVLAAESIADATYKQLRGS